MKDILKLFTDDRIVYYGIIAIYCIFLFNLIVWGYFSFIIILITFGGGCISFGYIFRNQVKDYYSPSKKLAKKICFKCNKNSCTASIKCVNLQCPWTGLMISEQIDSSLDKLFSKITNAYVTSWYKNLSNDQHFVKEIKLIIKFASSVLFKRLLQLDFGNIVLYKLLPVLLSHISDCKQIESGKKMIHHYAVLNRKTEIKYLRKLSMSVIPYVSRQNDFQCKIFSIISRELLSLWVLLPLSDVLCNPHNLTLVWLNLSKMPISTSNSALNDKQVEYLLKFIAKEPRDAVYLEMRSIFKDSTILNAFMKFLKSKNSVHLLQFCIDVDNFNKRMLKPDISSEELDVLYRDAWDIFSVYFSSHSPDCICFDTELVSQLRKVLSKDVVKLQNSKPLYQAYEQTYLILESSYWVEFHNSDEYFSWICGSRNITEINLAHESSINNENKNSSAKIGRKFNRIREALKSSTIYDGQLDSLSSEGDPEYGEDLIVDSSIINNSERDLSTWNVFDVTSTVKLESGSNGGQSLAFIISVETLENNEIKQWCVERRLADFYTLKTKLTEFHGVFLDAQLPSRRILLYKAESDDTYKLFLNQLLQKPELKGSDLLHMFLTSEENFEDSESAIGRLLRKSMPLNLRKEKGQNLESFISIFMNSIETKLKQKHEWKDFNEEVSSRKVITAENPLYKDNFNIITEEEIDLNISSQNVFYQNYCINGPLSCIIFVGVQIYNFSNTIVQLLLAIKVICGNFIDSIIQKHISLYLARSITPSKISYLIDIIENSLFPEDGVIQNSESKDITFEHIIQHKRNSALLPFYSCIYKCIQNSVMNKQLFYRLLDVIFLEIFPELQSAN
ncbi:sorting nexin-14-like [Daktulosphaira vitifoliae]|uniref:sorting nexin-14-like n=1 Tax=Daktulosphaira vitifoliae TaxID=58002 RepID=UPI0021A9C505|nr:sorting nexin-14-like [Daktulosphaira vitifoliae]